VESGRIGKQPWTTWHCERTGETARWSAHEALPQTPPGGKPPETPGPFPSDLIVGAARDPSRVRKPRQKRAPLTDPSRPGTRSIDEGKGRVVGRPVGCPASRRPAPKSGFKLEKGRFCLTRTDLLMEDVKRAKKTRKVLCALCVFARQFNLSFPARFLGHPALQKSHRLFNPAPAGAAGLLLLVQPKNEWPQINADERR